MKHLWQRFCMWLVMRYKDSAPDFIIGTRENPYMVRWWLLPRNPIINVYLHCFLRDDDDRALHDHPWVSLSYLISGQLREVLPLWQQQPASDDHDPSGTVYRDLHSGAWVRRGAAWRHRVELLSPLAWTLFITGPVVRKWGFHCRHGWRYYKDFVEIRDNVSGIGRGCE